MENQTKGKRIGVYIDETLLARCDTSIEKTISSKNFSVTDMCGICFDICAICRVVDQTECQEKRTEKYRPPKPLL